MLARLAAWGAALVILGLAAAALAPPAAAQELEEVEPSDEPPSGYELSSREVTRIARGTDEVESVRAEHPQLDATTYTNGPGRWQVSFVADDDELAQVHVDDPAGQVLEAWTGPQVAWRMARGYEGAFGRKVNAPYVWLPLCVVFLVPFVDPRRPFRMLHLDLLVLLAFGASHIFFNRGEISWSVPLVYPVLGYLLARMLWIGFRPRERRERLVPLLPPAALALGVLFLVGFRVALNIADTGVVDVGYASVVGADRIAAGEEVYGSFPDEIEHGDTYGPVNYLAYLPFEQALPWSGSWDDLPAGHAAAIGFDALTIVGLLLVGRRLRAGSEGNVLGLALAFAWASYPYTLYVLASNSNDALVAMLLVYALLAVTSPPVRGLLLGMAAAAKFAPLALAPLFLRGASGFRAAGGLHSRRRLLSRARPNHRGDGRGRALRPIRRFRGPIAAGFAFLSVVAVAVVVFVPDGGLRELYDRTVGYQAGRDSPFSVWGQVASLGWLHTAVKVAAIGLAVAVAFFPRHRGPVQVAALGAAVLIALELAVTHWFYFYIVWFAPLLFVALFAIHRHELRRTPPAERGRRAETPAAVPA